MKNYTVKALKAKQKKLDNRSCLLSFGVPPYKDEYILLDLILLKFVTILTHFTLKDNPEGQIN